ncbi:aconitate hydratase [Azotobacter chroococcum]|uniref:Aconitase n=1 Tax=Azotobacter chroococcum TaxID=353 RepID=A0A4R1P157_9GAMM|nr:aconitate hydratase [Azotobacter chroococcum]TBV91513.1 aconitate hydratase [Azotobacter chroococcum]TCL15237.1 aconitase [Azotobacter chroococcum]
MPKNVTQKLIASHLLKGAMCEAEEIAIKIDQTLTQDATGTMVMLELEAMGLERAKTEVSVQYVDHNLLQTDFKNADDHLFLQSACRRFGIWYSRPGNGVSHPVHMEHFGRPGRTLLGSDSHSCAAGSMGMLAIGAGGLEVAMAIAGEPFYVKMPRIVGVRLTGSLPDWVSAKDIILEMLRRYDVSGGVDKVFEYYGDGLQGLNAMDRHVIANMGAELGATTSVFPSDVVLREFLASRGREEAWVELVADEGATYDEEIEIDLASLVPMIACPSSPGNVVPVSEVAGRPVRQCVVGSSANPGLRDFAIVAMMLEQHGVHEDVSLDINPTSRQILENLSALGYLGTLIHRGARIHQAGCGGCIGMGEAPATESISLRTMPRNFPGRSGTKEDKVYLCSPETAAASAITGVITDPRTLDFAYPHFKEPEHYILNTEALAPPAEDGRLVALIKGPNIASLPEFDPLPDALSGPVLIKTGDNVSTDEIMPAGAKVLPLRSNIPEIAKFTFYQIDEGYYDRAMQQQGGTSFIVGGENYGQGSSREHAALAPRYLGVRAVLAKSFARIHWQNLCNFGIVPLSFEKEADYDAIRSGDRLRLPDLNEEIRRGDRVTVINTTQEATFTMRNAMTPRQVQMVLEGSIIKMCRSCRQS